MHHSGFLPLAGRVYTETPLCSPGGSTVLGGGVRYVMASSLTFAQRYIVNHV